MSIAGDLVKSYNTGRHGPSKILRQMIAGQKRSGGSITLLQTYRNARDRFSGRGRRSGGSSRGRSSGGLRAAFEKGKSATNFSERARKGWVTRRRKGGGRRKSGFKGSTLFTHGASRFNRAGGKYYKKRYYRYGKLGHKHNIGRGGGFRRRVG